MKKAILSILLALCMMCTLLPVTAGAADVPLTNLSAGHAVSDDGKLTSVTANFGWSYATANGRLVLMENALRSFVSSYPAYGDFTDEGFYYGKNFTNWNDVLSYDTSNDNVLSIVAYGSADTNLPYGGTATVTLDLSGKNISLSTNKTYYVYLWTYHLGQYYPDALICALRVKDGALQFAPATGRNTYDAFEDATFSNKETKYNVTVTAGANMTRSTDSGAETQNALNKAMTPVVYTANDGYHFPADYAVATVNGIMVRRDSATQITVYGTPSNNASITLTGATHGNPPSEETPVPPAAEPTVDIVYADGTPITGTTVTVGDSLKAVLTNPSQSAVDYTWALTSAPEGAASNPITGTSNTEAYTVKAEDVGKWILVVLFNSDGTKIGASGCYQVVAADTPNEPNDPPAPSEPSAPSAPAHEHIRRQNANTTTTTDSTAVTSPKTGDMGIAVYAALSIMSMTGSAWIVGTKRRH